MKYFLFTFISIFIFVGVKINAQTTDLQFVVELNNGTNYDVKVQIQGSSAFKLGTSNIAFNFNNSDLSSPTLLTAHNFSGGLYQPMTVGTPLGSVVSVNIDYTSTTGNGTTVATTWTDVATIRFSTLNPAGNSDLSFRTTTPKVNIFLDNNATLLGQGTWSPLNTFPLPVELTSFSASSGKNGINLNWQTKTETNNYGFEVERKIGNKTLSSTNWEKIGFIQGHGNSNSPNDYSYADKNPYGGGRAFYRLKQIDNDGKFEFSKEVEVEIIPNEFSLFQNYPNPFNPSTNIKFALPKAAKVTLIVYNLVGEKVVTLLDENKEAGYYNLEFNADKLSSGMYIYRLTAENFVQTKKMTLIR
jgi:hypothetical protein